MLGLGENVFKVAPSTSAAVLRRGKRVFPLLSCAVPPVWAFPAQDLKSFAGFMFWTSEFPGEALGFGSWFGIEEFRVWGFRFSSSGLRDQR